MAEKKGTEKAIANEVERMVPARVKSIAPDERAVTERPAVHLAKLASVDVKELVGRKIAEVQCACAGRSTRSCCCSVESADRS